MHRDRSEDAPSADGSAAEAAFGRSPRGRHDRRRLPLLLVCLALSVAALLDIRGYWFGLGSSQAQVTEQASIPGCPGRSAPEVKTVPARALAALRAQVVRLVPSPLGREYEAGAIDSSSLWSDREPGNSPLPELRTVTAGYEIRWWVLEQNGSEDDVAADVLEYDSPQKADAALALALDPHCRRDGATHRARWPAGAGDTSWLNPDSAAEWDTMFVRGRRLYRVVDVPPGYPIGHRQYELRSHATARTVEILACALPGADCPASTPSLLDTRLASLTSDSPLGPNAPHPPSVAQATAFANTVNIAAYDVPGTTEIGEEGSTASPLYREAFASCTRAQNLARPVASFRSPLFAHSGRRSYELVYSNVTVLPSAALAERYVASLGTAATRRCIAVSYEHWLDRFPHRAPLRLELAGVTSLPTPRPPSYRGPGAYRATAFRATIAAETASLARPGTREAIAYAAPAATGAPIPVFVQGVAFSEGRAVVALFSFNLGYHFSEARQRYLESALVGRAEANGA